jgi:hypothetical protein
MQTRVNKEIRDEKAPEVQWKTAPILKLLKVNLPLNYEVKIF